MKESVARIFEILEGCSGEAYCGGYVAGTAAGAKVAADSMKGIKGEVKKGKGVWKDAGKGTGGAKKTLSSVDAEEHAFNAIKGSNKADNVVLGKFKEGSSTSYDAIAKEMDAQYFNLDNWDELSSMYSPDEIWKINEKFLDIQTSSGREIYLSHNPAEPIGKGTYYSRKIQYLVDNGYKFVREGDLWYAFR